MSIEKIVKEIIAEQLEISVDEIIDDASLLDDLWADSLDIIECILRMEEEFVIQITDEDAEKIQTVRDAIDYIKENTN